MRKPIRRYLTPAERRYLAEDIKRRLETRDTPEYTADDHGNPMMVRREGLSRYPGVQDREIQKRQRLLDEGTVHDVSMKERLENDRVIPKMEEFARKVLTPRKYYHHKDDQSNDFQKAVGHIGKEEMNPRFVEFMNDLKSRRRMRDPDDPNAGNLEYLRD